MSIELPPSGYEKSPEACSGMLIFRVINANLFHITPVISRQVAQPSQSAYFNKPNVHEYGIFFIIGFLHGIGPVAWIISIRNNAIYTKVDLLTLQTFDTHQYASFYYDSSAGRLGVRPSAAITATSYFTAYMA